jgi:hypothetical protein
MRQDLSSRPERADAFIRVRFLLALSLEGRTRRRAQWRGLGLITILPTYNPSYLQQPYSAVLTYSSVANCFHVSPLFSSNTH